MREMNSKCKVLVVDDIHENIELVADMLKGLDVEIQKADGGAKAIELVDSFQPNIILLDLMMPQVNGWETAESRSRPDCPCRTMTDSRPRSGVRICTRRSLSPRG